MLVVLGTDRTGSCKSNYYTIMTTAAPDAITLMQYTKFIPRFSELNNRMQNLRLF
jgi:hypothetical protein